jgi:hypothetical protein
MYICLYITPTFGGGALLQGVGEGRKGKKGKIEKGKGGGRKLKGWNEVGGRKKNGTLLQKEGLAF